MPAPLPSLGSSALELCGTEMSDRLLLAVAAQMTRPPRAALVSCLRRAGEAGLEEFWPDDRQVQDDARLRAAELHQRDVRVALIGEPEYPDQIARSDSPPPCIYYTGNHALLESRGIGMCGSRDASARGLDAARACGEEVATHGFNVVSGYARGVDMETHLAALRSGGQTVIVLAEGILHFRVKRVMRDALDWDRVLVLSQFAPAQAWTAGGAMTRNGVIVALAEALIVIEASERGGTLNAGERALRARKPVIALNFDDATPEGNRKLFASGAISIEKRSDLTRYLDVVAEHPRGSAPQQISLLD